MTGERTHLAVEPVEGAPKRGRPIQKSRMVDITALLGLPQRQAAEVLGISESMLCKRYKERTQRKWPYRYLGKVEKRIAIKEAMLSRDGSLSAEEQILMDDLIKERTLCLAPVTIRVTDVDAKKAKKNGEPKRPHKKKKRVDYQHLAKTTATGANGPNKRRSSADSGPGNSSNFNPASVLMALADMTFVS